MLKARANLTELLCEHRMRGLEDDGRQGSARGLRVFLIVRDDAEQIELADTCDVARAADGGVEQLTGEGDAEAEAQADDDRQGHGPRQAREAGDVGSLRMRRPLEGAD